MAMTIGQRKIFLYLVGVITTWLLTAVYSKTSFTLPSAEYDALFDFYTRLHGEDWTWKSTKAGIPWNFTTPPQNPCSPSTLWQGILCSSTCESRACNVIEIDLDFSHVAGQLPNSLVNFTNLQSLSIAGNNLTGTIPSILSNITTLEELYLMTNRLSGTIPAALGDLTELKYLGLDENLLTGTIPASLGNLKRLIELYLHINNLEGTIPTSLGNLPSMQDFILYRNQLTGTIPESLGNLSAAIYIYLNENLLTGTIPISMCDLTALNVIYLVQNQITGTIPPCMGDMTSLISLYLNTNHMTGTIPDSLGNLTALINLLLYQNYFTGTIPASITNPTQLLQFSLYQNMLTGTIPASLGDLSMLELLALYENHLTGSIPSSLGNLRECIYIFLNQNLLTGTIPTSFSNLTAMIALLVHQNQLSGSIPASLGDLIVLESIYLYDNQLTGTIPSSIYNIPALDFIYFDQNYLTGSLSPDISRLQGLEYLSLSENFFTGTLPVAIEAFSDVVYFYLYDNLLSGSIPFVVNNMTSLREFDVSNNGLSGSLFEGLFADMHALQTIGFNNNAFTGTLPASIFQSKNLLSVVLAMNCFTGTLTSSMCESSILTQLILDGLRSAPVCSTKALTRFPHSGLVAMDSVHGRIPSCLLQHKHISVLHLGGNRLSGSIPNVLVSSSLRELVLSSNLLTGSIPDYIWQSNITSLDLSLNRLQGTLPANMLPAAQSLTSAVNSTVSVILQVNQLAGTIPSWLDHLPSGHINVLEGNLFSCNSDRSDLPTNDPKVDIYECGSDSTNYGLITFGATLMSVLAAGCLYRYIRPGTHMLASFSAHYAEGNTVRGTLEHLQYGVNMLVGMCVLGMIVFGTLSQYFASYADVYVWIVSGIYKMGVTSGLIMLFWFSSILLLVTLWCQFFHPQSSVNQANADEVESRAVKKVGLSHVEHIKGGLIFVAVVISNIVTATAVNGLYIYLLVSSDYTFKLLLVIAFFLSIFKIGWNMLLLRGSHYIETISDNTIVLLCLFNNLLAPLLAEMFVSSDCFLYIVSQAPSLLFSYDVYTCQLESGTNGIRDICELPLLYAQGDGTTVDVSIIPPFHYSYQCSFSLISSYAFVFIFRYIIGGLVEPVMRVGFYHIGMSSDRLSELFSKAGWLQSPLWQIVADLEFSINDMDASHHHLDRWQQQVQRGVLRRRFVAIFATNISLLICFGALFPPLALIIGICVVKDVMSIRLALGRYCEIMEAVQDESLKEQMVKVRESMDEEMLKAGAGIWNGVWYGMVMGTWIWAFVLFDTMASVEGVWKGLGVLIAMNVCPFIVYYAIKMAICVEPKVIKRSNMFSMRAFVISKSSRHASNQLGPISNPIFRDSQIEMNHRESGYVIS